MNKKKWQISSPQSEDIIENICFLRGLKTKSAQVEFSRPTKQTYLKIFDIKNIEIAKKRIEQAIKNQELIFVNGDYDVDGICGAAILYLGLTRMGAKVLPYLPHREKEGYGISRIGLDYAKEKGAKLIISVDCGIVDFGSAEYAKSLGLELIITDHHQAMSKKPHALTIVHSVKMCGSAVAWCLIRDDELLDLVAIATVADMMPMLGVNRWFVREGIKKLQVTQNLGLKTLIEQVGEDIGHAIAPRLNAVGRLDSAMDALRLLCTKSPVRAKELVVKLNEVNLKRQQLTIDAVVSARLMVLEEKKIYVLSNQDWHPGIIGLVAGKIMEETGRPTIAIAKGEKFSRGSARSTNGINIIDIIRQCEDILSAVGGHPGAAGFTILTEKITEFEMRITKLIRQKPQPEEVILQIDAKLDLQDLTLDLAKKLQDFEPYGISNPKPIFASFGAKISAIKTVGSSKHLKFKVGGIDAIAFGKGDLAASLKDGQKIDLAYSLEINSFRGHDTVQVLIKDLML